MENFFYTYFDFAENYYVFFRASYDSGVKGGALATIGYNICETYLKHAICVFLPAKDTDILDSHSLKELVSYIQKANIASIPDDTVQSVSGIEGFDYKTRYPGPYSFLPTEGDIDKVNLAVESARNFVLSLIQAAKNKA